MKVLCLTNIIKSVLIAFGFKILMSPLNKNLIFACLFLYSLQKLIYIYIKNVYINSLDYIIYLNIY